MPDGLTYTNGAGVPRQSVGVFSVSTPTYVDGAGVSRQSVGVFMPAGALEPSLAAVGISAPYISRGYIDLDSAGVSTAFTPPASITAQVQALMQQAADERRTLRGRGTYTVEGLYMLPGLRLEGMTFAARVGMAKPVNPLASANDQADGYLLDLYDPTNQGIWDDKGASLYNVTVRGNASSSGQTAAIGGVRMSHNGGAGGGSFIPGHRIENFTGLTITGNGVEMGAYTRESAVHGLYLRYISGYGWIDGGVDSGRSGVWDIGQCYQHNMLIRGNQLIYANGKSWGSGRYQTAMPGSPPFNGASASWDPTTSCGMMITAACSGLKMGTWETQESASYGLMIAGSGGNYANGIDIGFLDSDGDCRAGAVQPGINAFQARNLKLAAQVVKRNAGFLNGPTRAIAMSSCINYDVDVQWDPTNIASPAFAAQVTNSPLGSFKLNGHQFTRRTNLSSATAASLTVNPFDGEVQTFTLTKNTTFTPNMGGAPIDGTRVTIRTVQDGTGGWTIAFAANVRTNWSPVTTAGKLNQITLEWNAALNAWIQVGAIVGV